jgi:hypothetical protein
MRLYLFSNGAYQRPGNPPFLHPERAATSLGATSGTDVATAYELVSEGVAAGMQTMLKNSATSLMLGNAPVMILILHRPLVVMKPLPLCFRPDYSSSIQYGACPCTPVLMSFANHAFPTNAG